jgi:DNA-binding NarL/FixJ family response regulator
MRGLTPSEQRVLKPLKKGQPNKVIARELDIEETTVKVHVRRNAQRGEPYAGGFGRAADDRRGGA